MAATDAFPDAAKRVAKLWPAARKALQFCSRHPWFQEGALQKRRSEERLHDRG